MGKGRRSDLAYDESRGVRGMTKRGMLKAGLWAVTLVLLFIGAGGSLVLYFHHKFNPAPPRADVAAPVNALEAQRQDVEQFSRLLAMDRAFSPAARVVANRHTAELQAERVPLDGGRFRVALLRIAALADNGHTSLEDNEYNRPNCVPVRVTWFSDGLYVLRAKSAYADLLGARVDDIDGRPTRDVLAALGLLHGGADGWRLLHAVLYIQSPEILYGAGFGSFPEQTTWTFSLPNGTRTTRPLAGEVSSGRESQDLMTRWLSPQKVEGELSNWRTLFSNDADLPLSLRDFNSAFRRAWIDHGCTLFIQLKAIQDAGKQHLGAFLDATTEEMRADTPCNVILDMRFNTGGDYTKVAGFAAHLADFVPRGRIYLLTGPQTFSAAITTIAFIKQAAGSRAVILGEPVGDRLSFYGEGNTGCLPHSGLCVHYATGMHDYAHPCNDWDKCFWLNWLFPVQVKSLAPDETIRMTFHDYTARRDPVFERAVALAAGANR
jgi:hypothetical protein